MAGAAAIAATFACTRIIVPVTAGHDQHPGQQQEEKYFIQDLHNSEVLN
jgi:hypothetical protein